MIKKIAFAVVVIFLFGPLSASCYQKSTSPTDREIIDMLSRLEEGQEALKEEMNRRFDEMDKCITSLVNTTNMIIVVFGGLVGCQDEVVF